MFAAEQNTYAKEQSHPSFNASTGDDAIDSTGGIEQVDPVQFPLVSGGDCDPLRRDLLPLDQLVSEHSDRYVPVPAFRLEQGDRTQEVGLVLRDFLETCDRKQGVPDRRLPGLVLGEHDRKLDHLLGLEFRRGHPVENVAAGTGTRVGSRREFDEACRADAVEGFEGKRRPGVVRLVHDHEGTVEGKEVGEGEFRFPPVRPFLDSLQAGNRGGDAGEVRFEVLVVRVDPSSFRVGDAQGRQRSDDNADPPSQVLGADLLHLRYVEDRNHPFEGVVDGAAVRMAWLLERFEGLVPDGVGRNKPKDRGEIPLEVGVRGDGDAVGGQDRLSASGWQPQADVRDLLHSRDLTVGRRPLIYSVAGTGFGEFRFGPIDPRGLQEGFQSGKGLFLVFLQFEGHVTGP